MLYNRTKHSQGFSICFIINNSLNSRRINFNFQQNFICKANNSVVSMLYLTNRFLVALRLFSTRLQMTLNVVRTKVTHEEQPSVSLMFFPHFDVICDLLLNRRTATWNLFVLYNKELNYNKVRIYRALSLVERACSMRV